MKALMQTLLKLQTLEFNKTAGEDTGDLIAELRRSIPAPILGHYDRMRVRGKKGLAAVSRQVCTACHMRQPLGVIMTLKHGQDAQLCHNCDRYLYLSSEAEESTETVTVRARPTRAARGFKAGTKPGRREALT